MKMTEPRSDDLDDLAHLAHRQLVIAWWGLLAFVSLGLTLEALHGFKVDWYLNDAHETRQMMFRLAHAHGALLCVLDIVYALSLKVFAAKSLARARVVSRLLIVALVLLPGGFLLGGLFIYDGDPGLGIVLSPIGAVALLLAVILAATGYARPDVRMVGRAS
jgi:hypothetical protein